MLVIYKTIPNEEIKKEAKDAIKRISEWFEKNPKRRVCRAELWYGKRVSVKRKHITEDVNTAAKAAMK